jgi:NTP pyrophosphatase (non-canonical NTP hydrolase)
VNSAELAAITGAKRIGKGKFRDHCPGPIHKHGDRNPSMVFHDGHTAIVFNCFAGDTSGEVAEAMAKKIGCATGDFSFNRKADDGKGRAERPTRPLSPIDQAREDVLDEARRQLSRLDLEAYELADFVRHTYRLVEQQRRYATMLGDTHEALEILADCAALETDARQAEEELDKHVDRRSDRGKSQ